MICEIVSDAGLFTGLWDGLIALFSLLADIFWDVPMFDHCADSWFYSFGFLLGAATFGGLWWRFGILMFGIFFIAAIMYFIVGTLFVAMIVGGILMIAFAFWEGFRKQMNKIG